jgi:G3E family GTPase
MHGQVPTELLFPSYSDHAPAPRDPGHRRPASDRFETVSWTSDRLVSLARLQNAIDRLAPKLARAKGLFEAVEQPGRQLVLQFAGGRATLAPAGTSSPGLPRAESCSLLKSAFSPLRSWQDHGRMRPARAGMS